MTLRNYILLFSMATLVLLSSCKKEDNPPTPKAEVFFVRANINADTFNYMSGANNFYYFSGNSSAGDLSYISTVFTAGIGVYGNHDNIRLYLGRTGRPSFTSISNGQFLSLYTEGNIPYSTTADVRNFDGVELELVDENSIVHWNTIGDQTGSSFNVFKLTKSNSDPNASSGANVLVDATFNCKFYSDYYPDSVIVVKNGLLKLKLQNN